MRRIALSLATAAAALAAAACAPRVSVPPPRIGTPPVFEAASGETEGAIDLDHWWLGFGDPQLTGLIEQALSNSADARLAIARLEEAQAVRAGALSRFRLQGDLQANATTQRQTVLSGTGGPIAGQPGQAPGQPGASGGAAPFIGGNITTLAPSLNLSWEADLFGRRAATQSGADADLIAARFVYEGARAALAADVADALFVARGLVGQLSDAREAVRIQRGLRGVLHMRATRGLTAEADVARVDADLRLAEARAEALDAELTAAKRILLVLTGADQARTGDIVITETSSEAPHVPASLPGDLLRRRPDIREAEARFRAAVATAEVRRLDLFPRLTLNPGAGITQISGDFDLSIITWTLAGGLTLPLLDRRRLLTELRAQTARAAQAAATYEKAVQTAFSEADQALIRLSADRRRITLLEEGTARANTTFIAQRTLFDRGLSDLQQLLDAERVWRSAREAETSARTDTLRRSVTSFKALGGGWPSASPSQESPTR